MNFEALQQENQRLIRLLELEKSKREIAEKSLLHKDLIIRKLQHELFIRGSEKRRVALVLSQLELFQSENLEQALALEQKESIRPKVGNQVKPKRKALPAELPREEIINDLCPEHKTCACCGKELKKIGEECSERLEVIPMQFFVVKTITPRYACPDHPEEGVFQNHICPQIVKKGIPGASLVAQVLVGKYIDHNPLERQVKIFERHGIRLAKSTMCGWLDKAHESLEPVFAQLQKRVLESKAIQADETTFKVQQNNKKMKPINGYMWTYVGDQKFVWTRWNDSRSGEEPTHFLERFQGKYLQCDGYSGYNKVVATQNLRRQGCMAHARRKYVEALDSGEKQASKMLELIGELYAIEKELRSNPSLDVLATRHSKAKPILLAMKELAQEQTNTNTPQSSLGKASGYFLREYDHLAIYCEEAYLEIDNNRVERTIRPIALGRKNHLFAGSPDGAEWAASFYSLVETAKLHQIEPWRYISYLFQNLGDDGKCKPLLPDEVALILQKRKEILEKENAD